MLKHGRPTNKLSRCLRSFSHKVRKIHPKLGLHPASVRALECFPADSAYKQRRCYVKPSREYVFEDVHDDSPVSKYIQTTLSTSTNPSMPVPICMQFNVAFLGTGATVPTQQRMCSATVLQLKGQSLLFDAAEGVLRQIGLSRVALSLVTKIFITHLHGDHIFGLPSLLLSLQMASLYREQQGGSELNIHIYGPPGLCNYISMVITFSMAQSISGNIVVHELVGGDADPGPSRQSKEKQKGQSKDPKHRFYREFSRINISRRTIERNDDGTWTLETPSAANASVSISAAEVPHIEGVITFGYVVNEEEVPRTIDPIKATEQGVQPGPKYRLLKQGVSVLSDDETRMVDPESVYAEESKRKSRKFALIGDNCGLSPAMYKLSQDCDVLVHEATLIGEAADDYMIRGHASPEMAGRVARDVNAKVLVLNHISAKVHGSEEPSHDLVKLAQTTNQGASEIIVAHDFMELYVPFKGFDFEPLESAGLEEL